MADSPHSYISPDQFEVDMSRGTFLLLVGPPNSVLYVLCFFLVDGFPIANPGLLRASMTDDADSSGFRVVVSLSGPNLDQEV